MTQLIAFLTEYPWMVPVILAAVGSIGAVIGFVVGQYWQVAEFGLKARTVATQERTVTVQELLAQKQLYERLQILQNQASDAIPRYIVLRDERFASTKGPQTAEQLEKARVVQRDLEAEKAKLVGLIREYDQLEAKLSIMESRQPRWFVLPLPPMAPKNFRIEKTEPNAEGVAVSFRWDPPDPDPLATAVKQNRRDLFAQYGQEYRETPPRPAQK